MARSRRVRKASEEGVTTSLYLRRGNLKRAERAARRFEVSLSAYVDRAIAEKVERDESPDPVGAAA